MTYVPFSAVSGNVNPNPSITPRLLTALTE